MEKNVLIGILYQYYHNLLTETQSDAIEKYYLEDLSLTEIAELSGVTKQAISSNIKRSEKLLLKFEKDLGLYKKILDLSKSLEDLDEKIRKEVDQDTYQRIHPLVQDMLIKLN